MNDKRRFFLFSVTSSQLICCAPFYSFSRFYPLSYSYFCLTITLSPPRRLPPRTNKTPNTIDLDGKDAREEIIRCLKNTINPIFVVRVPEFARLPLLSLLKEGKRKLFDDDEGGENGGGGSNGGDCDGNGRVMDESQYSVELQDGVTEPLLSALKSVVLKIVGVLNNGNADEGGEEALRDCGLKLDGKVCLRYYPARKGAAATESVSTQRLGAHVDGNFLTLLWASASGLQVPKADALPASAVRSFGIPSLTASAFHLSDDQWQDVTCKNYSDSILVSVGDQWFRTKLAEKFGSDLQVDCPLLHRVALRGNLDRGRFSVPFLCRLVEDEFCAETDPPFIA